MRQAWTAAAIAFGGYLVVLGPLPRLFPPDPAKPNVAARLGYDIGAAHAGVVGWSLLALLLASVLLRQARLGEAAAPAAGSAASTPSLRRRLLEALVVFAVFFALYCPPCLARTGDFVEDKYFLTALWRMQCGDQPYRDFEFLYGPLMVFPAHAWMNVFGFSLLSYYTLFALLQGALFVAVMLVLQRYMPQTRARYAAFVLLVPSLFDILLGFNYLGWRRILPVFALLVVAARPLSPRALVAAAAILGVELAYSLEYGLAGLAACGGIYALLLARPGRARVVRAGAGLALLSVGIGLALIAVSTWPLLGDYFAATRHVLQEASRHGYGAFAFYFTAHSLSLFGLLALAVVVVGAGLRQAARVAPSEGDLLLAGAIAYALVSLKVALQRADIWHMASPFLALVLAVLLAPRASLFVLPANFRRLALALIAVSAVTNALGYVPLGRWYRNGLRQGAADVLTSAPLAGPVESREGSIQAELTEQDRALVELAEYLTAGERKQRPVMFYSGRFWAGHHLGVCPIGYTFYDMLYSDARAPLERTLRGHPDALVLLEAESYTQLFGPGPYVEPSPQLRKVERLASVLATVQYHQSPIENTIEDAMWKRALGDALRRDFEEVARFGGTVVLAKRADRAQGDRP
jgi:hypothetical protein